MLNQALQQRVHASVAAARNTGTRIREAIRREVGRIDSEERDRLGGYAVALCAVAAVAAARFLTNLDGAPTPFFLFDVAIAVAAAYGGLSPAVVALLASLLSARIAAALDWPTAPYFAIEGLLVAGVALVLAASLRDYRQRLAAAGGRIRELQAIDHRGRIVDAAFTRLDDDVRDTAVAVLDSDGRIVDWRAGATRLYGRDRDNAAGTPAGVFFSPELTADQLAAVLTEACRNGIARRTCRHRRADGAEFDAIVEIRPLPAEAGDGYTMIVHDLTGEQRWEAFAKSAEETRLGLREEADAAHRQLQALQNVTDPSLNALPGVELVGTLLDRLRDEIDAEGIALVPFGRFRRRVYCASRGVQCQSGLDRPRGVMRSHQSGRTLLIHNDAARVAEMSAGQWPDGISSLIAVPVVQGGITQAVIEVVNVRGRRATEWEIALVQVVAARIAGLVRHESYADAGAVA
jgi:PAS domain S-box-containing protein